MITRALRHPDGRTWTGVLDGLSVTLPGSDARKFAEDLEARTAFEDALYERLSQGFVLDNPKARAGEPRMLRHLGTDGYTGVMTVATDGARLIVNSYLTKLERDRILLVEQDGRVTRSIPLLAANKLALDIVPFDAYSLLVNIDHFAWRVTLANGAFTPVAPAMKIPASFISTCATAVAWYEHPEIVVRDRSLAKVLMRHPVKVGMYGGHTAILCAALSPDGQALAYCVDGKQIVIVDVPAGKERARLKGAFAMLDTLEYSSDGKYLVALATYGSWHVFAFDLGAPAAPHVYPKEDAAEASRHFAISPDGKKLAVATYRRIDLFELATGTKLRTVRADLVHKQCRVNFVDRYLGVLTDQGCAALYATE